MAIKSWFQHDCSARQKDRLSSLIDVSVRLKRGHDLYGKFWVLNEMLQEQNLGKKEATDTLIINERTLSQEWRVTVPKLRSLLEQMSPILLLRVNRESLRSGTVEYVRLTITLPKFLSFIGKRFGKDPIEIIDGDQEGDGRPRLKPHHYKRACADVERLIRVLKDRQRPKIEKDLTLKTVVDSFGGLDALLGYTSHKLDDIEKIIKRRYVDALRSKLEGRP